MTSLNPDTATAPNGIVMEFISLMWMGNEQNPYEGA